MKSPSNTSESSGSEVLVTVTGKPVKVTAGMKFLSYLSPAVDGVVKRTEDGQLMEQTVASPSVAMLGHVIMSVIFLVVVLAYLIYSLIVFYSRPEVTIFTQVPSDTLTGQQLRITATCTNPPHCGNMTIKANYSGVARCAGVGHGLGQGLSSTVQTFPPVVVDSTSNEYEEQIASVVLDLCDVPDYVFSINDQGVPQTPGLLVHFEDVNPGYENLTAAGQQVANLSNKALGVVTVETIGTSGSKGQTMKKVVSMDGKQVKTLVLGRTISKEGANEKVVDDHLIPAAVEYDGKRTNGFGASLFTRYDRFAVVEKRRKEGSLIEVLANVGGCASVIGTVLLFISPLIGVLLPGSHA